MSDLIERLEKATGPDRVLDRSIISVLVDAGEVETHPLLVDVPHYTASFDAARTLVPEGFYWSADSRGCAIACNEAPPDAEQVGMHRGHAVPEIALCIAALRARAAHSEYVGISPEHQREEG